MDEFEGSSCISDDCESSNSRMLPRADNVIIQEFTKVKLKTGVIAVVMEVFDKGAAFLVEYETGEDSWDTMTVAGEDIASILKENRWCSKYVNQGCKYHE